MRAYRQSNLAQVMNTLTWAASSSGPDVTGNALHPHVWPT